ncbi:MAG: hypothetical protein IRY89_12390 [Pseudolabrys sp.]|nr:hypothetical protein [Pseudolabrys sp.]
MMGQSKLSEQLAPVAERLRGTYSRVQPVSQVVLHLLGNGNEAPFVGARRIVLEWINQRAGRPLPPEAWRGEAFELEDVGSQRTAAISIDQPRYWAARLDDGDRDVPQRDWVTEVGIAERQDRWVIFGTRLQCVTIGQDAPFEPSIPRFVRTVVERIPNVRLEGRQISMSPWIIRTEDDVGELVDLIERQTRSLDVIVCSLPEGSEDTATAMVRVDQIHRRTLGVAHVAVITGPASFFLSDRVGKEFSVFRGAVRSYRPGFDTTLDEPFRHPLGLPDRIASWSGGGPESYEQFLIRQAILRSVSGRDAEQQIPPFTKVRRIAAQLKLDAARDAASSETELLRLADQEISELQTTIDKDRATYEGLVQQYEQERDQAREQVQQLQALNGHLRQRIRALEERLRTQAAAGSEVPIPSSLDEFEAWCRDHLSGSVEVHNRALQAVKKSQYEDISLLYKALLLLRDAYVPMKRDGGLDKKRIFEQRCAELGLSEEPTFAGERWGEEGDTYKVRYAGRPRLLDRHLKKGSSRDERYCFRLYFFWDEDNEQVVVGWLPSHLDTRIT